jgi:predicted acylesterase/phospholipase RssA
MILYSCGDDDNQSKDPDQNFLNHKYDGKRGLKHDSSYKECIEKSDERDEIQPRLLVISVDVADGKTVAFDSYYKKGHSKNPVYYGDGITIDHIMASGTIPVFYKFREIGGRKFCDGGWLSNTPFRELLQAHRDYWVKAAGEDADEIPDLDVVYSKRASFQSR